MKIYMKWSYGMPQNDQWNDQWLDIEEKYWESIEMFLEFIKNNNKNITIYKLEKVIR